MIPLPPGFQIETIKEFRIILDNYRKIKRKAYDVKFELVDEQTLPASFSFYQESTGEQMARKYVSVHRDDECFDWQINEYEVNIETNEVVSMRPVDQTSCWFPSLQEELNKQIIDEQGGGRITIVEWQYDDLANPPLSDEELKQTASDFLTELLGDAEFRKIERSFDFNYDSSYDNYWGEYFFRWQVDSYTPPDGCAILMPPFIQVSITKSGHIFSYENTTSFFEYLPSYCETPQAELIPPEKRAELSENCANAEIPLTGERNTVYDSEKKTLEVSFWNGELQEDVLVILPYEPETDFAGCSDSAKDILRHVQELNEENMRSGF